MSRTPTIPPPQGLLHALGDVHFGAFTTVRSGKLLADLLSRGCPTPRAHAQVGDAVENGLSSEDTTAVAWLDQLPAEWRACIGNHDVQNGVRTGPQAATGLGMPGINFAWEPSSDVPILLFVGPDSLNPPESGNIALSSATQDWLDGQLEAADRDCVIVCHAPLKDTVVGDTAVVYSSSDADLGGAFNVDPDAEVRAILEARPRAKIWLSGHTHSPIWAPGFLKVESVGARDILSINASAPHYTGRVREDATDEIRSLFLTFRPGFVDVRVRDHGAGVWVAISNQRVTSLPIPD